MQIIEDDGYSSDPSVPAYIKRPIVNEQVCIISYEDPMQHEMLSKNYNGPGAFMINDCDSMIG